MIRNNMKYFDLAFDVNPIWEYIISYQNYNFTIMVIEEYLILIYSSYKHSAPKSLLAHSKPYR